MGSKLSCLNNSLSMDFTPASYRTSPDASGKHLNVSAVLLRNLRSQLVLEYLLFITTSHDSGASGREAGDQLHFYFRYGERCSSHETCKHCSHSFLFLTVFRQQKKRLCFSVTKNITSYFLPDG